MPPFSGRSPRIALDATYSIGDELSGVGLYSREILLGLAAAHPEMRFDFAYRPHRLLVRAQFPLPSMFAAACWAGPLGAALRLAVSTDLNQRLPPDPLRGVPSSRSTTSS